MLHSRSRDAEECMTRDEYLQHAEECERLAKTAQPSIRHALLSAAEMWRKMADAKRGDGAAPTLDSKSA